MNKIIFPLNKNKAPAVPKGTDWREYHGAVNSDLIGVKIPSGVIVFDLDTYKGVSTDDVETALGCKLDWVNAELQRTRNGGIHYAFSVDNEIGFKNGTDLLGVVGFDTRSSGKGYIATGAGYTDLSMIGVVEALHEESFFPALPVEAVEKLRDGFEVANVEDDDFLDMVVSQPLDLDQDQVADYMSKLTEDQARSSEQWLKVMFALWHQSCGAKWGWVLFDEFSQLALDKYDEHKNRARWESCARSKKTNPITFATVIDMVGGQDVVSDDKLEILKNKVLACEEKKELKTVLKELAREKIGTLGTTIIVKSLIKKFSEIYGEKLTEAQVKKIMKGARSKKEGADYYDDYIFLTSTATYMHRETKKEMGPRAFDVAHNRDTPADNEGNPQSATAYVNDRIKCVFGGMYAPLFDDVFTYEGVDYFNTYVPTLLNRVVNGATDIVDRVIGHIAHLLPDPEEQQLVINYLAHNVQFPGKKIYWAMILQGVQGDGKSFFAEMMKHVLGFSNCRSISAECLDEKYSPWAEGNIMLFIEEMKIDNKRKYETSNKMKPYISNPTVSVRRMRQDIYECINTTNYFALTNFKDALPIDDTDRRYCVLFSQWQSKEKLSEWMKNNPDYYQNLYDDMRMNAGEILDWLLCHKIPDSFLKLNRAPDTRAKQTMIDMSKGDDFLIVEDAISEFQCEDINDFVLNVTKLSKLVNDSFEGDYEKFPKSSRLKNILLEMGYHNIGRYKTAGECRKNQSIYCKDDRKNAIDFKNAIGDFVPF